MSDEAEIGSAGAPDRRGHPGGGSGEQSPLQARAAFRKNRSWELVVGLNPGACARGGAQHGFNRETQETCRRDWEEKQLQVLSLEDTIEFLRHCHRRAPFFFFNGNTFADVGRQIVAALFAELPTTRRHEVQPGDRVKTLRGSMKGTIVRVLEDGRVVWRADSGTELTASPESLIREQTG